MRSLVHPILQAMREQKKLPQKSREFEQADPQIVLELILTKVLILPEVTLIDQLTHKKCIDMIRILKK